MEFKQIEAFVNVIKYKNFSKAAEATYLTQPTISAHVSSLEKELGVRLVDRKGKESLPTPEGRAFYNYALSIVNTREHAINALKAYGNEIAGSVDICTSSIPGIYIVPELIARFHNQYPNVVFRVHQSDSEQVISAVQCNLCEIGFTGTESEGETASVLISKDIPVVITPDNEKFRKLKDRGGKLTLEDIAEEAFVWREEGSATRRTFEEWYNGQLKTVAVLDSIEAVQSCVRKGLGISVISGIAAKNIEGILSFELEGIDFERKFYMVYSNNTSLSPTASRFRDFVKHFFAIKQ